MSPRPRTEEEGNRARGSASSRAHVVVLTDETLQRMAPSRRWLCTATVVAMFTIALGGSVGAEDGAVRPAAETLWKMDPRTGQWVEANDLTWVRGYDREGRPLKDIKPEDYVTGNDQARGLRDGQRPSTTSTNRCCFQPCKQSSPTGPANWLLAWISTRSPRFRPARRVWPSLSAKSSLVSFHKGPLRVSIPLWSCIVDRASLLTV